jgi:hypothetical protein
VWLARSTPPANAPTRQMTNDTNAPRGIGLHLRVNALAASRPAKPLAEQTRLARNSRASWSVPGNT